MESVIKDLLYEKDMETASEMLLSGTSAGGMAVYHNCDSVKSMLPRKGQVKSKFSAHRTACIQCLQPSNDGHNPEQVKYKCMADAGWFINTENFKEGFAWDGAFWNITQIHNMTANFDSQCLAAARPGDEWRCW